MGEPQREPAYNVHAMSPGTAVYCAHVCTPCWSPSRLRLCQEGEENSLWQRPVLSSLTKHRDKAVPVAPTTLGHRARHAGAGWFRTDHWKEGAGQGRTEPLTALRRIAKLL